MCIVEVGQRWNYYDPDNVEVYMTEEDACWSKDNNVCYFMTVAKLNSDNTVQGHVTYRDGMGYGRTQCIDDLLNSKYWTLETDIERVLK